MRYNRLLRKLDGNTFSDFLNSYQPSVLNKEPFTEIGLLTLYSNYTDPLLYYVRTISSDNVFTLGNEARAMFGHLADYGLYPENRKNLTDAYGHFRRLNLDACKIICDELDAFLFDYLNKHFHYNYKHINKDFLPEFSRQYYQAQKLYLVAQTTERTGSDRISGNIIEAYFTAAKSYADLFTYLQNNRTGIERAKWVAIVSRIVSTIILILGILQNIFP